MPPFELAPFLRLEGNPLLLPKGPIKQQKRAKISDFFRFCDRARYLLFLFKRNQDCNPHTAQKCKKSKIIPKEIIFFLIISINRPPVPHGLVDRI